MSKKVVKFSMNDVDYTVWKTPTEALGVTAELEGEKLSFMLRHHKKLVKFLENVEARFTEEDKKRA